MIAPSIRRSTAYASGARREFHLGAGPALVFPHGGGFGLSALASLEGRRWEAGLEYRYANFATSSLTEVAQTFGGRVDWLAREKGMTPYLGVSAGYLWESSVEETLKGGFAGGQVGVMLLRAEPIGRVALEAQLTAPLFGNPNLRGGSGFPAPQSFTVAALLLRCQF